MRALQTDLGANNHAVADRRVTGWQVEVDPSPITDLATRLFTVPIAHVAIADRRVIVSSATAASPWPAGGDAAFRAGALLQDHVFVASDLTCDPGSAQHPLVAGDPHLRFYAAVPLRSRTGVELGTLCIADRKPRATFDSADRRNLVDLAALMTDRLEAALLRATDADAAIRLRQVAPRSPDGIVCADHEGRITYWNAAAEALFGYAEAEVVGLGMDLIEAGLDGLQARAPGRLSTGTARSLVGHRVEIEARHRNGTEFPIELSMSVCDDEGRDGFGLIIRSLTERRLNEQRLYRLAYLDPLTKLPNRAVLRTRLVQATRGEGPATLLIIDLDRFKAVNDTLGHSAGDAVLEEVARRVLTCIGPGDTLARLGGDEFALLLPGVGNPIVAGEVADAIIASVSGAFLVGDDVAHIGASIGAALYPAHGDTSEDLLANADLALYAAKAEGRNRLRFFGPGLRQISQKKRTSDLELRRALDGGQFELLYQPQIRLSDQSLIGAEALIRWRHPDHGLVSPAAFLPALEASQDAGLVGDWVMATACAQAADWRRRGAPAFRIAVNLFGAQFLHGNLATKVRSMLIDSQLPAEALELEITESIILRHDEAMIDPLRDLKQHGVAVAFDDYGAGYSSLNLLKRYPLSRLKVDQSFVRNMCEQSDDAAIVRSVLYLGRSLGFKVTAEGVERPEQASFLSESGCEEAQGFLFGHPLTAAELSRRFGMARRAPRHAA